jgi:hypothetical protein
MGEMLFRAAWPVLVSLIGSVLLAAGVWFAAMIGTQELCRSMFGDFRVAIFGDRHLGLFGEYVHWLPLPPGFLP